MRVREAGQVFDDSGLAMMRAPVERDLVSRGIAFLPAGGAMPVEPNRAGMTAISFSYNMVQLDGMLFDDKLAGIGLAQTISA